MPASRRPRTTTTKQSSGGKASSARQQSAASSRPRDYVDRSKLPPPPREIVTTWARFHDRETFKYFMREHYKRAEREEIRKMHEARRKENEAKRQARLEEQDGTKASPAGDAQASTVASSMESSSSTPLPSGRRGRRARRSRGPQQEQGESNPSSSSASSTSGPCNDSHGGHQDEQHAAPDIAAHPAVADRRIPAGLSPAEQHRALRQHLNPRSLEARRTHVPNEFVAYGSASFGSAWQLA